VGKNIHEKRDHRPYDSAPAARNYATCGGSTERRRHVAATTINILSICSGVGGLDLGVPLVAAKAFIHLTGDLLR
jgi:hypothetical protein